MIRKTIAPACIAAALAVAGLTACGTTGGGDTHTADDTVSAPATDPTSTAPAAADTSDSGGDQTIGLKSLWTYTDGVTVQLSDFSRHTSSSYAAPSNAPYIKFTVTIDNNSSKTLELGTGEVQCTRGDDGNTSESIFDDGLDGTPSTHLRPGHEATFKWGCEFHSTDSYLQVEATPAFGYDDAIFAGTVQ
jgi:hypothetical protein